MSSAPTAAMSDTSPELRRGASPLVTPGMRSAVTSRRQAAARPGLKLAATSRTNRATSLRARPRATPRTWFAATTRASLLLPPPVQTAGAHLPAPLDRQFRAPPGTRLAPAVRMRSAAPLRVRSALTLRMRSGAPPGMGFALTLRMRCAVPLGVRPASMLRMCCGAPRSACLAATGRRHSAGPQGRCFALTLCMRPAVASSKRLGVAWHTGFAEPRGMGPAVALGRGLVTTMRMRLSATPSRWRPATVGRDRARAGTRRAAATRVSCGSSLGGLPVAARLSAPCRHRSSVGPRPT